MASLTSGHAADATPSRNQQRPTARRAVGAAMLGLGAMFGPKEPDEHWSKTAKIEVEAQTASTASGRGLELDYSSVPERQEARPPARPRGRWLRRLRRHV